MSKPLTIREVKTHPVIAPLAKPVRTASGSLLQAPVLLIDLHTAEGVTGRSYVFAYQATALKALDELVRALGATLVGEPAVPFEQTLHDTLMHWRSRCTWWKVTPCLHWS